MKLLTTIFASMIVMGSASAMDSSSDYGHCERGEAKTINNDYQKDQTTAQRSGTAQDRRDLPQEDNGQ